MSMGKLSDSGQGDGLDDGVVAEINITPLTDIFLVLLIIFMVTSSALVEAGASGQAGVQVDLPGDGTASEQLGMSHDLVVAVLEDGRAISSGKELDDAELLEMFDTAARIEGVTTLVLQADRGVPHGRVVQIMELAKSKGLSNLAIATRSSE